MLGKASEIKIQHVYDRDNHFERQMELWLLSRPNAEIIDIKFSSNYDMSDESAQVHALIIYKEESA